MVHVAVEAWTEMIAHAEAACPDECCGILLGTQAAGAFHVRSAAACVNQAVNLKATRFLIDPEPAS